MSLQVWITLLVTVAAAILLITEKLRPDLVALLVLAVLGISGIVTPAETFAGFSGSAVMTIVGISVISEGLRQTGVTRSLGRLMYLLASGSERKLILVTTLVAAILSLVMNNIAAVGVLLPATLTLARRGSISPSRLMLPLAYGVLLGGMATLFTTANLIVSGALKDAGFTPFGVVDFFPIGGPIILVGTLYLVFLGRKWMPDHKKSTVRPPQQVHAALARLYGLDHLLSELEVQDKSPLAGHSIRDAGWEKVTGIRILRLIRPGQVILSPGPAEVVRAGDHVLVQGQPDPETFSQLGLAVLPGPRSSEDVTDASTSLVELIITPHGDLPGQTLQQANFREKYNLFILAIWREGHPVTQGLANFKLRAGDALLAQASAERLARLQATRESRDLIILEEDPESVPNPGKYTLALLITAATLILATFEVFPIAVVVFAGATLLLLTGCMRLNDVYQTVEWQAVFLIAGMWPLSTAIRTSGLADHLINSMLGVLTGASPLLVALAIIIIALLLTQVTGGQVAALVLAPLAIASAIQLGVDPHPMALAAALGCSLGFPTPFGHPVNIMVMTSGGYSTRDFLRVGLPLTILIILVILIGLTFYM